MSLTFSQHRQHVDLIIRAALVAADPAAAVKRNLHCEGQRLTVGDFGYDLGDGRIFMIGAGKASVAMGMTAAEILGDNLIGGLLIAKKDDDSTGDFTQDPAVLSGNIEVVRAGHPISDQQGVEATAAAIHLLKNSSASDLVLFLISGGASALLTQPSIPLADWQTLVDALLASGCTINELNSVRKRLDRVKGGGLARMAAPANCATLILSDVVGNPLDVIGSGPTTPNPDDPSSARKVLTRYGLDQSLSPKLWETIDRELNLVEAEETAGFPAVQNIIVGDVRQAAESAVKAAAGLGFDTILLTAHLEGEAREVGRVVAALAKDAPSGACLVLGGETTVTLRGHGLGGRNLELALAAAVALEGWENVVVASFATDGDDGPTIAAGAIATGETVQIARSLDLDPITFLDANDSYHFFETTGGLLVTGPTGSNVNDLVFIMKYWEN
jgi:hydroxypyruvate reductase